MKNEKQGSDGATFSAHSAWAPVSRSPHRGRSSRRPRPPSESNDEKRKARYQANSPDVQAYYRVNRYPATRTEEAAVLIKRTERHVRRGASCWRIANSDRMAASTAALSCAAPVLPPAALRRSARSRSARCARPRPGRRRLPARKSTIRKSVCTHCSVGCTVTAEVANGVWIGQEPSWDSPINRGSHCAKGASVRELVSGERRLKYPMKLVNGQWTRVSWDQAIGEIGDKMMTIREQSGPDSVYWLGSAKMTNEGSYLFRKFGAFWGTNNTDHQARICHSTTVTGVANTWGYGAMTNSYNDIRNAKTLIDLGRQSSRSASGIAATSARRRRAEPRQLYRGRSAPDAYRGARDRIRAAAPRHRHSGALRHDVAHHPERLGRQGVHPAARLRL